MRDTQNDKMYRIGVDVGGTNTDAVLACGSNRDDHDRTHIDIVASFKAPTSPDITNGICAAIKGVVCKADVPPQDLISVNIGTTHFINAILERDQGKISRVAVLRLCGPFGREVPPFAEFPGSLRKLVQGHVGYLNGGLEIDGRVIGGIDEDEVRRHVEQIRQHGDRAVVVIGIFSPLDVSGSSQEEKVGGIIKSALPLVDIVLSRDIGAMGFLERENASILNASILKYSRTVIRGFREAMRTLQLECPLFISQNDGTVLEAAAAARLPIHTFASGATNSLTGAAFLAGLRSRETYEKHRGTQVIVIDIGGTSSDFAAISPSGFPLQSPAIVKIGGVRTALSFPEVFSIGLGGGSRIFVDHENQVIVGPQSVGYRITEESKCFGGDILTATDIAVACNAAGNIAPAWDEPPSAEVIRNARTAITGALNRGIVRMKTSDLPVIALIVGGGSIIRTDELNGVKMGIDSPFSNVANAVGAAVARIAGEIDCVQIPSGRPLDQVRRDVGKLAVERAIANGAVPSTVYIAESELIPLPYTENGAVRAVVKAVGELSWKRGISNGVEIDDAEMEDLDDDFHYTGAVYDDIEPDLRQIVSLEDYAPTISTKDEWLVSETDLALISEGVAVLGTGGGGSVRTTYMDCLATLKSAGFGSIRIIDSSRLSPESQIGLVAGTGSPSVSNERLAGENELRLAVDTLRDFLHIKKYDALMGPEVGGANGMCALPLGAKTGICVVDADTLGRAFPRVDMSLPYVYNKATPYPAAFADARGNVQIVAAAENFARFEAMGRSATVELGSSTAMALNPLKGDIVQQYCCQRTLSSAWYIGREICLARMKNRNTVEALLAAVSGAKLLHSGKITDVSRQVVGGWTVGTATILAERCEDHTGGETVGDDSVLSLKYQNEFLCATTSAGGGAPVTVCTSPDLITVVDQDGYALGAQELRYGLNVHVVSMPCDPLWHSPEALAIAAPQAFHIDAKQEPSSGLWQKPKSVIEAFRKTQPLKA